MLDLLQTLVRARLIAPMRPDRYVRMVAAMARVGMTVTVGFAGAAGRCPDRPRADRRGGCAVLEGARPPLRRVRGRPAGLTGGSPTQLGIMCRNHRGFVEALVAANRIGANVLLLNTSFAGPALVEVVEREGVDTVVYDEEFSDIVEQALAGAPTATRILGWTDTAHGRPDGRFDQTPSS